MAQGILTPISFSILRIAEYPRIHTRARTAEFQLSTSPRHCARGKGRVFPFYPVAPLSHPVSHPVQRCCPPLHPSWRSSRTFLMSPAWHPLTLRGRLPSGTRAATRPLTCTWTKVGFSHTTFLWKNARWTPYTLQVAELPPMLRG